MWVQRDSHGICLQQACCNWTALAATEWIPGWKRNNWIKKTDSKPVMNQDLMMKIDDLQKKIKLKWVGGRQQNWKDLTDFSVDVCSWSFVDQRKWRSRSVGKSRCTKAIVSSMLNHVNHCLFFFLVSFSLIFVDSSEIKECRPMCIDDKR